VTDAFFLFAAALLVTVLMSLVRAWRGPTRADRIMAAQMAGTGGVGIILLLGAATGPAVLDVAIVLALLAAFAAIAFVKASTPDGAGDPEEGA
jgi:multicomponent Na+:H+ antiporter subunit F